MDVAMLTTIRPTMTLEDYLTYDDGSGNRYELIDGVLVEMGAESDDNTLIGIFLIAMFLPFVAYDRLRNKTEIAVSRSTVSTRYPDLMVLSDASVAALAGQKRSLLTLDMPGPQLVVEVVSPGEPGEDNYDRDYIDKRREYAARGIGEYWIVDPARKVVFVLCLDGTIYKEHQFQGPKLIVSPTFPKLKLTAEQVVNAGR
jgi:Uma2 family endonuclease